MRPSKQFRQSCWDVWAGNYTDTPYSVTSDACAIEIEVETECAGTQDALYWLRNNDVSGWTVHDEGSLRGAGFELVSSRPASESRILRDLSNVMPLLRDASHTFRAAIHVHVNVQWATREDYIKILLGYFMREPMMFEAVGEGREQSVFCVPWSNATAHFSDLVDAYIEGDGRMWIDAIRNAPKYAAVNMQATSKFGSLEFRHMQTPGNIYNRRTQRRMIADFVRTCNSVVDHATTAEARSMTELEYINHVFEEMDIKPDPSHVAKVYGCVARFDEVDPLENRIRLSSLRDAVPTAPRHITPRLRAVMLEERRVTRMVPMRMDYTSDGSNDSNSTIEYLRSYMMESLHTTLAFLEYTEDEHLQNGVDAGLVGLTAV